MRLHEMLFCDTGIVESAIGRLIDASKTVNTLHYISAESSLSKRTIWLYCILFFDVVYWQNWTVCAFWKELIKLTLPLRYDNTISTS
jgi:hypothetical protein